MKKSKKQIDRDLEECVCANECTGLFQKISPDKEEIAKFHKMYNGFDGYESIEK